MKVKQQICSKYKNCKYCRQYLGHSREGFFCFIYQCRKSYEGNAIPEKWIAPYWCEDFELDKSKIPKPLDALAERINNV